MRRDPFYTLQPRVFIPVIRGALTRIKEIQMAFVFGSSVSGDTRADSDIDVMIIGDEPSLADLGGALLDMECTLDREVHVQCNTLEAFIRKHEKGSGLIPRIMAAPKIWLIGSEHQMNALLNQSRLVAEAEKALGSRENAVAWLSLRNWRLGGARPIDLTPTKGGMNRVERVLQQERGWVAGH